MSAEKAASGNRDSRLQLELSHQSSPFSFSMSLSFQAHSCGSFLIFFSRKIKTIDPVVLSNVYIIYCS
jgi:hypothetical protein